MQQHGFSELLDAAGQGDAQAAAELYALVYDDLRQIAHRHLRGGHAASPRTTSLVHEAYLRLARGDPAGYNDRVHFLSTASRAMRQILIDQARRRASDKRGGGRAQTTLGEVHGQVEQRDIDLVALDLAIAELERVDAPLARVVEWRFFGGLTVAEIAEATDSSESTVKRDLREASAFLRLQLDTGTP
jgi:RNA polymerase sigma factor (TIGR02999 family)